MARCRTSGEAATATTLIHVPAWGNANLLEIIWLAIGVVTMVYTGNHLGDLLADVRAVKHERRVLRAVAWGYARREIVRFVQGGCVATLGVYAALQSPAAPQFGDKTTTTGLVLTSVLFIQLLLVIGQSLADWRTRHEVTALLRSAEQHPVEAGESSA